VASENEPTHFYVTPLSNASQKLYPSDTLSSFKFHLAQPVDLGSTGRWEVGVCEVSCPVNVGTYASVQVISANNALIYCDLISPQFVGSQYVRCLRKFIVPTTYCNYVYDNVYYNPVEKRRFRDIQIQILRLNGTPVVFTAGNIPVKIVLHFRRVSLW
jgi:hypothetical protein